MNCLKKIIGLATAAMLITGCGASAEPPVTTEPTIHTEPVTTTVPATETLEDFEFGQEVWCVEGEDDTYLVRYAVVDQHGELVEVVPYFTSDVQQLRESMVCTYLIEMDQVYLDRYDAMVAVAEANCETFEEYWGEYNE